MDMASPRGVVVSAPICEQTLFLSPLSMCDSVTVWSFPFQK